MSQIYFLRLTADRLLQKYDCTLLGPCAKMQGSFQEVAFPKAGYWVPCLSYQDRASQGRVPIGQTAVSGLMTMVLASNPKIKPYA